MCKTMIPAADSRGPALLGLLVGNAAAISGFAGVDLGGKMRVRAAEARPRAICACAGRPQGAILARMTSETPRIPPKPSLDGLEDKWTQRWAKECVVQV